MSTEKNETSMRTVASSEADVSHTGPSTRAAGGLLAIGSLVLAGSLAFHPPPSPDPAEFMAAIADGPTRWMAVHWAAAIALALVAAAGLVVLSARSRLTQDWWTVTAWAVLVVGALWVTTTALAEATVITSAAAAGDTATFEAWQLFAEGHSIGFGLVAVAIVAIAANEAQSARSLTPVWASWLGAVAAAVAFVAYVVLGFALGIAAGGPIWVVSAIVMSLWALWFGIALTRPEGLAKVRPEVTPV